MRKLFCLLIVSILLSIVVSSAAFAGEKANDLKQVYQDKNQIEYREQFVRNMKANIKMWHKAVLNNQRNEADKRLSLIMNLIETDINRTAALVSMYRQESEQSRQEFAENNKPSEAKADDRRDVYDDRVDLKEASLMLKVKRRMFTSIRKSPVFSNRYRLFNDYVDLIRHEQGTLRQELAEDVTGLKEE
jgi:hypothetical protein